MGQSKKMAACRHNRLTGPIHVGQEPGAYCEECGAKVPCPCPPGARKKETWVDGKSAISCGWCGKEFSRSE